MKNLKRIWLACIILHNMTLRDQQTVELEMEDNLETVVEEGAAPEGYLNAVEPLRDAEFLGTNFEGILGKVKRMENKGMCHLLQRALVKHVWQHAGNNAE